MLTPLTGDNNPHAPFTTADYDATTFFTAAAPPGKTGIWSLPLPVSRTWTAVRASLTLQNQEGRAVHDPF
ncbi:MAG: hypothetical protein IPK95_13720 [Cellvibrionales bacterium]|nr:hypothetical protein [Cellvibrionales bacterium]